MSAVLVARIRDCLNGYQVAAPPNLDLDELAAEILDAALPVTEAEYEPDPIWWRLAYKSGVCPNCLCTDCGCCIGCGQVDADIFGSHGYWCVL